MKKIFNPIILLMLFIVAGMTIQSYGWDKNNLTDAVLILPSIFSNNMVLQRDKPLPIWGKCSPAEEIIVEFNGQVNKATADSDGNWKIILDPVKAGGPYKLQVLGKEKRIYENVLVGEVWLCSGQSNMEMPVFGSWAKVDNYEEVIKNADYPNIRLLTVKKSTSTIPLDDVETEGWVQCSPKTLPEFSAVAYFFGKDIHINHDVPVGLIHSSWGGTVAEAWTSPSSLKTLDDFKKSVNEIEQLPRDKSKMYEIYNKEFLNWEKTIRGKDRGMSKTDTIWKKPDLDDRDWKKMKLPTIWEDGGLPNFDGVVYFRKTIELTPDFAGSNAQLNIGPCDDWDFTWFNGKLIGKGDVWDKPRHYQIPGDLIREGKNVIVVRVQDNQGGGGIWGEEKDFSLVSQKGNQISLSGEWSYKVGVDLLDLPRAPQSPDDPNRPMVLYNAMIHPLIPFSVRGIIWYQGENNTHRAFQYRKLFKTMILDWREQWGQGDFPFYFVQLANFMSRYDEPGESEWAELREAQLMALELPNTGMGVAIDIGEADDIHPTNKKDVGIRLALWARNKVYGENIECSGPLYSHFKKEKNTIRIYFKHVECGLISKIDNELKGFAIAGEDKKFFWARAKIEGETVVISHPEIEKPVAVRYGWADNPECNLCNKSGLPASPFRTDKWSGLTVKKK